ncbi:MAG: TonB family protein [Bacteroidia bacterium]|nr:TonB family protein [Bacteroidia bacterium]
MMKRNEKKVPKFDEIIFENRNKDYGAYDLRKRYKAVTSFSIIGTVVVSTIIVILLSLSAEPATATKGKELIVIIKPELYKPPEIEQPEVKPPKELFKPPQNITPKVVDDTSVVTSFIPITDVLTSTTVNGDINDTVAYTEPAGDLVPVEKKVFIVVEEPPVFPGGDGALLEYIGKNIAYPQEAIDNNVQGRIILKFVVTEDGSVGEIVLLKGVDPLLDKEAVRVVGTLPRFKAGRQSGTPVSVWYSIPVLFQLIQQ